MSSNTVKRCAAPRGAATESSFAIEHERLREGDGRVEDSRWAGGDEKNVEGLSVRGQRHVLRTYEPLNHD